MFRTIQGEGGSNGPEWLSSHPDPGNRFQAITREAQQLKVQNPLPPSDDFRQVRARLSSLPPAYTAQQIAQMNKTGTTANTPAEPVRVVQVAPPAGRYRAYRAGSFLGVAVPENWEPRGGNTTLTYTPSGAYFERQGGAVFTHGVEFGLTSGTGNLMRDTESLLQSFARSNPQLRRQAAAVRDTFGGRAGLTVTLANVSDVTGAPEVVEISTTQLRDGQVLYLIGVAPRQDTQAYQPVFRRVRQQVQITDR